MKKFEYAALVWEKGSWSNGIALIKGVKDKLPLTGQTLHPIENMIEQANILGKEGWDAIAYTSGGFNIQTLILKREINP